MSATPTHAARRVTAALIAAAAAATIAGTTAFAHSPGATSTPATATAAIGSLRPVPVYWIGETAQSLRLYREFRTVPNTGGYVHSALSAMMRMRALDPDYVSPWRGPSRLRVHQTGAAICVDLSRDAFRNTNVGSELAERAVQELIYTATAAAFTAGRPASTVTVTVDGRAYDAWGAVRLGSPMRRAPRIQVKSHAWVTSPQHGDLRKAGVNTFAGYGTSFEANFLWTITRPNGAVVARGFAMGGTGDGGFGPFTFKASMRPGTYVVHVSTEDPSGGREGPGPHTDTKTFTVR